MVVVSLAAAFVLKTHSFLLYVLIPRSTTLKKISLNQGGFDPFDDSLVDLMLGSIWLPSFYCF